MKSTPHILEDDEPFGTVVPCEQEGIINEVCYKYHSVKTRAHMDGEFGNVLD